MNMLRRLFFCADKIAVFVIAVSCMKVSSLRIYSAGQHLFSLCGHMGVACIGMNMLGNGACFAFKCDCRQYQSICSTKNHNRSQTSHYLVQAFLFLVCSGIFSCFFVYIISHFSMSFIILKYPVPIKAIF